jgi:lipopolysaccharide export system permease protein
MRILDRYVVREFMGPFILSISAFVIIVLSGQLFMLVDFIVQKNVPVLAVIRMLLYSLPGIVVQVLPVAVLFAVLISLGRLARDSELSTIRAAGVPFTRIVLPLILMGAATGAGGFWLGETVVPWASHKSETIVREIILKDFLPSVEQDIFFAAPGGRQFYVGQVNKDLGTMERIMVYETEYGSFPRIVTARRGSVGEGKWTLQDGAIHELDAIGHVVMSMAFEKLEIIMDSTMETFVSSQKTPREMTRKELKSHIDLFEKSGIRVEGLRVEYHLKLAEPMAALVFAVIGAPLVARSPRRAGGYFGVVAAAVLSFAYFVVQAVARSVGMKGMIQPVTAVWIPNVAFLLPGVMMLLGVDRPRMFSRRWAAGPGSGSGRGRAPRLFLVVCVFAATLVLSLLLLGGIPASAATVPVRASAQQMVFDGARNEWELWGEVEITYKDTVIRGDHANIDARAKIAVIAGSVSVTRGDEILKGEVATYDMSTGDVVVENAWAKLKDDRITGFLFASGAGLTKKDDYLRLSDASVTTCDLDKPHWRIEVRELEVYVDDRIVLRSVSYYEGNVKLVSLPRLTIPLKEDERLELPKIGYGAVEGWYVKGQYNYRLSEISSGSFHADYYQLLGPAAGLRNQLKLGAAGVFTAYVYELWNKASGNGDTTLELSHSVDLPASIKAMAGYKYRDYLGLGGVSSPTIERTYTLNLDRRVEGANTSFAYTRRDVESAQNTEALSLSFRHSSTLPLEIKLTSDASYRRQVKGEDVTQNVLNYRVQAARKLGAFSLTGLAQAQVYVEEESTALPDVKPPPWKALKRLPEVTAISDRIPIGSTPLSVTLKGVLGRYTEDAIRGGIRSEVTSGKAEADVTLRMDPQNVRKWLSVDGSVRGVFDAYGANGAQVALGYSAGVQVKPTVGTSLRLSYDQMSVSGASPFRFDAISPSSRIGARLTSTFGPLKLTMATAYDFKYQAYDTLTLAAQAEVAKGVSLELSGAFDIQQALPKSVLGRVVVQPSPEFQLRAGGYYDFARGQMTRVESSADMRPLPDWRIQWVTVYDLVKGGFVRGDVGITRDLHCREIAVTYQFTTRRVWLEFRLKAFPGTPLGFGLGEDGVIFGQ